MKLVTFRRGGASDDLLGALRDDRSVVDLGLAAKTRGKGEITALRSMLDLIRAGQAGLDIVSNLLANADGAACIEAGGYMLRPPIPNPPRVRGCGLIIAHLQPSYDRWAEQEASKSDDPVATLAKLKASGKFTVAPVYYEQVIYLNSNHLAIFGPDDEIRWPAYSTHIDYELELGIVIGRDGHRLTKKQAADFIFGYTLFNDWSARDEQTHVMPAGVGPGAGKDHANSIGPCIVTADEIPDPSNLELRARVNGEQWSCGRTSGMYHQVEDAIVQLSQVAPLVAGEIFSSGTVETGCGFEQGRRLAHGDVVELEAPKIGVLRNRVIADLPRLSLAESSRVGI